MDHAGSVATRTVCQREQGRGPGANSRAWLILLAADEEAEVRLAAVTLMATSTDATLLEQAWQAAIHDRDPRVAAMANRLRERRSAVQRR